MKWTVHLVMAIVFMALSPNTQAQWSLWGGKSGSGNIVSNERSLEGFAGVDLNGSGNVIVSQGREYKVVVEVDDNLVEDVKTVLKGSVLHIGMNKGSYNNLHLTVYVTMPEVKVLDVSGSGNIVVKTALETTNLASDISGSGNIRFEGTGSAGVHKVNISGSGSVDARSITAEQASVDISGSGSCDLAVTKTLNADIAGSGSIRYKGSPQVSKRIAGSGSVRGI